MDDRKIEAIVKSLQELGYPKEMCPVLAHKQLEYKEKERDMRNKQKMEDESFRKCPPVWGEGEAQVHWLLPGAILQQGVPEERLEEGAQGRVQISPGSV